MTRSRARGLFTRQMGKVETHTTRFCLKARAGEVAAAMEMVLDFVMGLRLGGWDCIIPPSVAGG